MQIYCTTKNSGPSWSSDPLYMVYLGTSLEDAVKAVDTFAQYEQPQERFPTTYLELYSALPRGMDFKVVRWYMADGWWRSIVEFTLD